jgi:hypothetical protein
LVFYQPAVTPLKLVAGVMFQVATVTPLLLAASTVVWLAAKAWRADVAWPTAVSIAAHACVAHTLLTIALASAAGALLPASFAIDVRNPPYSNVAQLVGYGREGAGLLLAEIDIRTAYALMLVWFGIHAADPRGGRSRTTLVVATCFVVRLLLVLATPSRL